MKNDSSPIWLAESRKPILNEVLDALQRLEQSNEPTLVTLWGGRGVGKTLLLDLIENQIKDLDSSINIHRWDLDQTSSDLICGSILETIVETETDSHVVLLDNLDSLLRKDEDGSDFFTLELEMFLPAIESAKVVFITSSQIELTQWREDEVRLRQKGFQIPALSRQETNILIKGSGLDPKHVFELTFGHPKAIDWIHEQPDMTQESISRRATTYFLKGLSQEAKMLANQICLMPLFNPFLLRTIAQTDDSGADLLYLKHLEQIREFIGQGLVFWDMSVGSYRFLDNAVRRLLARDVKNQNPDLFEKVNTTAMEYYQAEARSAGYLHRHLVSAVFHLANNRLIQNDPNVGVTCLNWVCDNLTGWEGARWSEVKEMWTNGAKDLALAEEIKDLIGQEAFDEIIRCLGLEN